jgi:hypothetical protein
MSITIQLTLSEQRDFSSFFESVLSRDIWIKMIGNGKSEEEVLRSIKTLKKMYDQVQRAERAGNPPTYVSYENRAS